MRCILVEFRRRILLLTCVAAGIAAGWAAWAGDGDIPKPALPRLKVNKSAAPRLSDAPKKEVPKPGDKPHADNTACFVCHGNYQDEPLAQWHAKANVGCAKS